MFRPARAHWFLLGLGFLVVNGAWVAWSIQHAHAPEKGLHVVRFTPQGEASPDASIRVLFDRPLAPPGRVGQRIDRSPIRFQPVLLGECRYRTPCEIEFSPSEPLPAATAFVATLDDRLRGLDGARLIGKRTFAFTTTRLCWLAAEQVDMADNRPVICLRFNDRVDPREVAKRLTVRDRRGRQVKCRVCEGKPSSDVRVRVLWPVVELVTVELKPGLRGLSGPLGIDRLEEWKVVLEPGLRVTKVKAEQEAGEAPRLLIRANYELDPASVRQHVKIEPPVKFGVHSDWRGIVLAGSFRCGARYRITFSKGLRARSRGVALAEACTWTVRTPDAEPFVRFACPGVYLSTKGRLLLPLECENVNAVEVSFQKIYPNNVVVFLRSSGDYERRAAAEESGYELPSVTLRVQARRNERTRATVDLRKALGEHLHGLTWVTARDATAERWRECESKLVLATNLGLLVKHSPHSLLAWVGAIDDASPVADAVVRVYSRKNQLLLEGRTDQDGFARFQPGDLEGERAAFVVTASKGDDVTFVELERQQADLADLDIGGRPVASKGYEAFVYSDRGVYRPGETVHLRTIVRGPRLRAPERFFVEFQVRRPDGRVVCTRRAKLSPAGAAHAAAAIAADAPTGRYAASVRIPGADDALGAAEFFVEDFLPVRLRAEAALAAGADHAITATVSAESLLGRPAAGRTAACRCVWRSEPFSHPKWPGYVFFDTTREWAPVKQSLGEKKLDAQGRGVFHADAPPPAGTPARWRVEASASVREISGRAVTARAERVVDAHPLYVGLGPVERDPAHPDAVTLACAAVRPDGRPADAARLKTALEKLVWRWAFKRDGHGRYRFVSWEEAVPVQRGDVALREGRGQVRLRLVGWGRYRLRVWDPAGGAAASRRFWHAGRRDRPEQRRPDRVEVTTDRPAYQPGDVAQVTVRSPFPGRLIFCAENDAVRWRRVAELRGRERRLRVPIRRGFGPTIYFTAAVVRPLQAADHPVAHRAMGVCPAQVRDPAKHLRVRVAAPARVRPGEPVEVALTVQGADAAGAETAVAAVDEGVCQVTAFRTPDPWAFFTGKRRLVERTADVYALIHPDYQPLKAVWNTSPAGDEAESFDRGRYLNAVSALRVKPVALWLGTVKADASGRAVLRFTAPDFQGRLRLMAVAAGREGVGAGEAGCDVAPPVLVEASWPRFASTGDAFEAALEITNRTGRPGVARATVRASGALLADESDERSVRLQPGQSAVLRFPLRAAPAPGVGRAEAEVTLNGETTRRRVELPVRLPAPVCDVSGAGCAPAGRTTTFRFSDRFASAGRKRTLVVSPRPDVELGGALDYLLDYPYGCMEQTTSCAFGLLAAGPLAELLDPGRFDERLIHRFVQDAVDKLDAHQAGDGGFRLWGDGRWGEPWLSAYVGHFLIEAERAGYEVRPETRARLLGYLKATAAGRGKPGREARCYACYVLALAGRPQAAEVDALAEEADDLNAAERCWLASARWLAGDAAGARRLLGRAMPAVVSARLRGEPWRSDARDAAVMLTTLLDAAPNDPRIPLLVKRLNQAASGGRWASTQENARALLALSHYARTLGREPARFEAVVEADGKVLGRASSDKPLRLTLPPDAGDAVQVRVTGQGRAYFYWTASGLPADGKAKEFDAGLRVRRRFLDRDGKPLSERRFRQGELYQVELSLRTGEDVENIAVVDLLPAGLEIENPNLTTSARLDDEDSSLSPDHMEARDDRLLLFVDELEKGSHTYRYLVRAVTRGRFALGPVRAECMYDPLVCSVSGAGRCEVVE